MDNNVLSLLKDLPLVIAICLFGFLIIKTVITGIIKLLEIWREASKERAVIDARRLEVDNRRNEIEEKNARIMEEVTKRLEKLAESDYDLADKVADHAKEVVGEVKSHDLKVGEIVSELRNVRDEQFKVLQGRLDEIITKIEKVENCTKNMPTVAEEVTSLSKMVADLKVLITKEETDGTENR